MNLRTKVVLINSGVLAVLGGVGFEALHLVLNPVLNRLPPDAHRFFNFWLITILSAGLLTFVISDFLFVGHFLLRRLKHLEQDVAGIANGSSLRIRVSGNDEITRLGKNIDDMVKSLHRITTELQRTRDIAECAEDAKTRLLASASHQMRTPLNGIIGLTQLLQHSSNITAEDRENLGMIEESGNQLLLKINTLLDHSLLETGDLQLIMSVFSIEATAQRVIGEILPEARRKGIGVWVDFASPVPPAVEGDPNRLGQVLRNLLDNAVKFTVHGSVGMRIRRTGEDRFVFEVQDTGPGIAPEGQAEVFQPFAQSHVSRDSIGLGLSICSMLASLMDGEVSLQSETGAGCCFTFRARLTPHSEFPVNIVPAEVTVQVIHADEQARQILSELLRREGMQVVAGAVCPPASRLNSSQPIFWGLYEEPPVPVAVRIRPRMGFESPCRGVLFDPFMPAEVHEVCDAILHPPLRVGLCISNAIMRSLASGILTRAGHVPVVLREDAESDCNVIVADASEAERLSVRAPVVALVAAGVPDVSGANAVVERTALSAQLASVVEIFRRRSSNRS